MNEIVVATYYENTRYGTMVERERVFGGGISLPAARVMMERWIERKRSNGQPLYPQFDIALERRAS